MAGVIQPIERFMCRQRHRNKSDRFTSPLTKGVCIPGRGNTIGVKSTSRRWIYHGSVTNGRGSRPPVTMNRKLHRAGGSAMVIDGGRDFYCQNTTETPSPPRGDRFSLRMTWALLPSRRRTAGVISDVAVLNRNPAHKSSSNNRPQPVAGVMMRPASPNI